MNNENIQRLTAEEFQKYCELLENNTPSRERYYAVVLLADNQPQFYGIADCDGHEVSTAACEIGFSMRS